MSQKKYPLSAEEERSRRIWKYYNWTRAVLAVLLIAGLYYVCTQS